MLWERTALAIEGGMLRGMALKDRITKKMAAAQRSEQPNNSTDGRRLQLDDRTLRSCCANSVAISVMTLSEPHHKRMVQAIVVCGRCLDAWHTEQNRRLRSIDETERWILRTPP